MKTIEKNINETLSYSFKPQFSNSDLLFFDIETTGFSPKTSALYLIGVMYYSEGNWQIIQWFADDYESEKDLLICFFQFVQNYSCLIHFNGMGFDIPFLRKKCSQHKLDHYTNYFEQMCQIDIYKQLLPHKKKLQLENLKQKTVEAFLHLNREDTYSGGELIAFYRNYLQAKLNGDIDTEHKLLHSLLLHNQEDLSGMLKFSNILNLVDLLNGSVTFTNIQCTKENDQLCITAKLPYKNICNLFFQNSVFSILLSHDSLSLNVKVFNGKLKYFYENYKDYYYLPLEDTAIHKSVAAFVDKEYREKAKKETCYLKKEDTFIPYYGCHYNTIFKKEYKAPEKYILYKEELLNDTTFLIDFIQSFLCFYPDLSLGPHIN
ncbi:MAG: ribonuclease H-like domain-containing protein [Lachnospiraceae bacterium]|nr:ribonuclease H-like domain-containing protein [Lachnospiraceae bacterium]